MAITSAQVRRYMQEHDCSMMQAKQALVNIETNKYIDELVAGVKAQKYDTILEAVLYLLERTRPK